jgi:inosine-uridine nucleoside N-ribohydrolase
VTQRKLIIDADPGIGDALAIMAALLDPDLDLLAVTAVAGTVSAKDANRNVHGLLATIDPPKWPRTGTAADLVEPDHPHSAFPQLRKMHGPSGLAEFDFPVVELHRVHDSPKVLIDLVRQYPNAITLLTLGPLTNVAAALERAPEFLQMLGSLVCLGGAIETSGDATPVAEQNLFFDPEAARKVLRSPATKTLVPLDITNLFELTIEQFARIVDRSSASTPPALQEMDQHVLHELVQYAFRASHHCLGRECLRPRELLALASISRPGLFKSEPQSIDVEVEGRLTRGMSICDRRPYIRTQPNIDVLSEVDSQGVLDYLQEIFSRSTIK